MGKFNKHAPLKCVRANQGPFMNKELRKAMVDRCRLHKRYLSEKSEGVQKTEKHLYKSL